MTAFEDFVNTELPLRANIASLPTANNFPRFTGVGRAVEERTAAQVRTDINVEDGATADQTNAEIKTAYEANANTNEFSDAEQTKLAGIESVADVTDATNVAAAGAVMDSDISPAEGFMRKTGAGAYTAHKSNLAATVAPGVSDDGTAGYSIGSIWIDTTADKSYICVDATTAAAVWNDLTAGGGGGGDVVGPASATDNAIARFDSTTGKLIQDSAVTIDDTTGDVSFSADAKLKTTGNFNITIDPEKTLLLAPTNADNIIVGRTAGTAPMQIKNNTKIEFRDPQIYIHSDSDGNLTVEADVKVKIPADTDLTGTLTITGQLDADNVRVNGNIIEATDTNGDLTVRDAGGTGTLNLGRTGADIELGWTTLQVMKPNTDLKIDLGTTTKRFNHGFFAGGVRTKSATAATVSSPPTDAQLDTELGVPATLGAGFCAFLEDTTDNQYWWCVTDGTSWYVEELTKAV